MTESEWWQDAAGHWHNSPRPVDIPAAAPAPGDPAPAQYSYSVARPCPVCEREWGPGLACQSCGQVGGLAHGIRLSTAGRRLSAYLLDSLLLIVTLGLGWFVWMLIVFARGQTPAKQLLGMRVVRIQSGTRATWGTMFLRDIVGKTIVAFAALVTCGLGAALYFWLLWDKDNQELWDKIVETVVVEDPQSLL